MRLSLSNTLLISLLTLWVMLVVSHAKNPHDSDSNDGHKNDRHRHHRGHKYPPTTPLSPPTTPYYSPYTPPPPPPPPPPPMTPSPQVTAPASPPPSPMTPSNPPTTTPSSPPPPTTPTPSSPPVTTPASPPPRPTGLKVGFYNGLCPKNVDIEAMLINKVQKRFGRDSSILPALLRMQFHDCFVHGCDASILINGPSSEKNAGANLSVREYELIDALKSIAEVECPNTVSCADIIAIATKEVIKLGGGPDYAVETGRNDGRVSNINDVDLPSPFSSFDEVHSAFLNKKFTTEEMVVLLGCHSVGTSNCAFFQDRLNEGGSQFDPNMDSSLRRQLIQTCGTSNNFAFLDQNPQSSNNLDNSFYDQILKQRGILAIDQALAKEASTKELVLQLAQNPSLFNSKLASAMVKLQAHGVLVGSQGEIRKTCSQFN